MNRKIRLAVWTAFWLSALLALMNNRYLWDWGWGIETTITSGVIGLCLGIVVLIVSGWTLRSIILVILGLIIGQWGFFLLMFTFTTWYFGGFAP